jgi:DNA repair protein RadC
MFEGLSNQQLLTELFGVQEAHGHVHASLRPLFKTGAGALPRKCQAARELVLRWLNEEIEGCDYLGNPQTVRNYLRLMLVEREHESFFVLYLDNQNRLTHCAELFRGTLTQTAVYPREILKTALAHNAASLIFAHNHPSGQAEPSLADQQLTHTLQKTLALVDIKVLDHFVVAGAMLYSFAENGLL